MQSWLRKTLKQNRSFVIFISLMLVFRSAFADWNVVPTGSMKPTIVEGDRILVNKMAYDLRVPFTNISLYKIADPKRGDIVTFDSAVSDLTLVKRIIGVPGDVVELNDNVLTINGQQLDYTQMAQSNSANDQIENLFGVAHAIRVQKQGSVLANFPPVLVPAGHYLALGDNRDNSSDSRVIGFVPRYEIVGRTSSVVFSVDYDNYYLPRADRFMRDL
ncbi:signal peptidase I [Catenovulum sp. SX2]|uniref:signal peptidase I n=1 Tax=Catenovulum sp. SX2 TaxID=3398614 RepID=UPI003F829924